MLERALIIGAYAPLADEISPQGALAQAAARGATIAFPSFEAANLQFRFLAGEPVQKGPFVSLQPAASSPEVRPDLILVPLLAVDSHGTRLGQGGGHYDRVLPELRKAGATIIGLGWAMQLIDDDLPADPWDVPLDGFASPEGLRMWR